MSELTSRIIHATAQKSSALTQRSRRSTLSPMTLGAQALCDALLGLGDTTDPSGPAVKAERLAAALVLLGAVDDDLVADLDAAPAPIRAVFDAAG
jgi:hypothetical protein